VTSLHPDLEALSWLVGNWTGKGRGLWSSEAGFEFVDEMSFEHDGRPILVYHQRTSRTDRVPSHAELGFVTPSSGGDFHWTIAEPNGITEVLVGRILEGSFELETTEIGHTPTTDNVTTVQRRLSPVDAGRLRVEVAIGVNGEPPAPHTESLLRRDSTPSTPATPSTSAAR